MKEIQTDPDDLFTIYFANNLSCKDFKFISQVVSFSRGFFAIVLRFGLWTNRGSLVAVKPRFFPEVILVGHSTSAGGLSVTDCIHKFGTKKILMAFYVTANMPPTFKAIPRAKFTDGPDADKVPRVYIKTMHDQSIPPDLQDAMIRRWPPSQVFEIESDHSPFFSNPFVLFGFIVKAVASID
ncbi:hypothetical protein Q3G72_013305 [Acer saccharum]|nr:hypothetical protein Q3G72_013305 [Acer saccharum]